MSLAELHLREPALRPRTKPQPKAPDIPLPFFYASSADGTDENLLILLHGLGGLHSIILIEDGAMYGAGDTHLPFAKLGKSLKLPQTAILALRAPQQ